MLFIETVCANFVIVLPRCQTLNLCITRLPRHHVLYVSLRYVQELYFLLRLCRQISYLFHTALSSVNIAVVRALPYSYQHLLTS